VREQPSCWSLLDEIEKAHPRGVRLALQVCGEGRLSDARGRTTYFRDALIVMTSNLGAAHRRPSLGFATRDRNDKARAEAHFISVVEETFRPEFVNRLDRIVVFHPLTREEARRIATLAIGRVCMRRGITERGVDVRVSDAAIDLIAETGFSEAYGARALERHIEHVLVTPLARLISRTGGDVRNKRLPYAQATRRQSRRPARRSSRVVLSSLFSRDRTSRARSTRAMRRRRDPATIARSG